MSRSDDERRDSRRDGRRDGRRVRRAAPDANVRQGGQATVELALVLPFVFLLVLFVVQVGLVVREQVTLTSAAREAARSLAVSADLGRARRVVEHVRPGSTITSVTRRAPGEAVDVDVEYRDHTTVPIIGRLIPVVVLRARASMLVEV